MSSQKRPFSPWARRCPNGHTSVTKRSTLNETVCVSCGLRWKGDPIDARDVDSFPVNGVEVINR